MKIIIISLLSFFSMIVTAQEKEKKEDKQLKEAAEKIIKIRENPNLGRLEKLFKEADIVANYSFKLNEFKKEMEKLNKKPEEILTPEQIDNALKWYDKHQNHVNGLVNGVAKFPPRLNEDKRDCRLWKPEHWNWFLVHYH